MAFIDYLELFPVQFYKLSDNEQQEILVKLGFCTLEDLKLLRKKTSLSHHLASSLIENAVGCFPLPLGLAFNFVIDNKPYVIPMVIEESSVIATASKTAKWIYQEGCLTTKQVGMCGIGQIQIPKVKDFDLVSQIIYEHKKELIDKVNANILMSLVSRGGGAKDLLVRKIERSDGHFMVVIHFFIDCKDAMGANIINQACEFIKPDIEQLTQEKVGLCILSNLTDTKITRAEVVVTNIDPELGEKISEASLFAQLDPYRAATNNKGVMNGIDPVLIATGNDWRAVEAGIHAYAARSGSYTAITTWQREGKDLHGILEAPIQVGIVGGVTKLHPISQICLRIMKVQAASELSRIIAAVGLVQNLGALKALVSEGITKGHMRLHISNLAIAAGAREEELPFIRQFLEKRLATQRKISESDAREAISVIRAKEEDYEWGNSDV
ncbi:hydroxymethylglutaryl-CoA reductase, degradative [Legionella fallonii]|uniref:3-hydroxy-3-methylglutaryl coenzyme A reductase n=1 Tax=Legionella fallonii LLAP-10 TaxID=1212491 RepID=A0A098G3Q0_9GAMM|nr:hydroxymethylglutaryl-CoA reductase, degradative [Legionella fallonii]CEG56629.1 3-hydroxy-3-methylglutaryl-coenzyme A reductase [Legionella fallonii LLAP-10]